MINNFWHTKGCKGTHYFYYSVFLAAKQTQKRPNNLNRLIALDGFLKYCFATSRVILLNKCNDERPYFLLN